MSYTRKQLKEAVQARNDLLKENLKNPSAALKIVVTIVILVSMAVAIGALAGFALSSDCPPLIADCIIGVAIPSILVLTYACCYSCREIPPPEEMSEEHKQVLREYNGSTEYKIKNSVNVINITGAFFGIGAGLVALGLLTTPIAIGVVTVIAAMVAQYPLSFLTNKAIECFFPEGNKQPNSSVDNTKVDANHVPSPV